MNKSPCGIPNSLTYDSSFIKYLTGVAINNSNMYETPSRSAIILKNVNIVVVFVGRRYNFLNAVIINLLLKSLNFKRLMHKNEFE